MHTFPAYHHLPGCYHEWFFREITWIVGPLVCTSILVCIQNENEHEQLEYANEVDYFQFYYLD